MNERILVVDDEASVREVARAYLEREGFFVDTAEDGLQALAMAERRPPQLVVLDLMLPGLPGEEVCRELRSRSDVPIVMLTARAQTEDRIAGLELGADDYLAKPFSPRELVVRVKAVLRRAAGGAAPLLEHMVFDGGRLHVDTARHVVLVAGEAVSLTPSEYRLLVALARHPGRVYSRLELVNRVQGHDHEGYERTIDAHVKNLRRKIEPDPGRPRYVETVHGVGYRLAAAPA